MIEFDPKLPITSEAVEALLRKLPPPPDPVEIVGSASAIRMLQNRLPELHNHEIRLLQDLPRLGGVPVVEAEGFPYGLMAHHNLKTGEYHVVDLLQRPAIPTNDLSLVDHLMRVRGVAAFPYGLPDTSSYPTAIPIRYGKSRVEAVRDTLDRYDFLWPPIIPGWGGSIRPGIFGIDPAGECIPLTGVLEGVAGSIYIWKLGHIVPMFACSAKDWLEGIHEFTLEVSR